MGPAINDVPTFAGRQLATPLLVRTASARALAQQREPVPTLVADHRVVGATGVDRFTVFRILRRLALDSCDH